MIVQVSFLGTDNSQLCAALARLDPSRFAGVAVVPTDVSEEELVRLKRAGVRGVRVPDLTSASTQAFFEKLRANGFHLEVQLEGPRLAPVLPAIADQGVNVVIDHFGLPSEADPKDDPLLKALSDLSDRKSMFFKFSAHYRTPFDVWPHAQEVLEALSEKQIIWGSDWPHTQHESPTMNSRVHKMSPRWGCVSEKAAVRTLFDLDSDIENRS